jgi:hypothetical protein
MITFIKTSMKPISSFHRHDHLIFVHGFDRNTSVWVFDIGTCLAIQGVKRLNLRVVHLVNFTLDQLR